MNAIYKSALVAILVVVVVLLGNIVSAEQPQQAMSPKQYINDLGPSLEGFGMVRIDEAGKPVSFSQGLSAEQLVTLAFRLSAEKVVIFLHGRDKAPSKENHLHAQTLTQYLRQEGVEVQDFLYVVAK